MSCVNVSMSSVLLLRVTDVLAAIPGPAGAHEASTDFASGEQIKSSDKVRPEEAGIP